MKKFIKIENITITFMTFFIMWVFSILPYKLVFLDPVAKAVGDIDLTDIVFSKLREESKLDTNIVVVNIGILGRLQIGEQINVINRYNPKVVAVDAIFQDSISWGMDSVLFSALNNANNLVLAGSLLEYNADYDYYDVFLKSHYSKLNNVAYGFVNFPTKLGEYSKTVREFAPSAYYKNNLVYSFASQIASRYDTDLIYKLNKRRNYREIINYRGNMDKFIVLEHDFVNYPEGKLDFLKNKIIILGYLGNRLDQKTFNDIYFTPYNDQYAGRTIPDMYGVIIHANIVSMLLDQKYITKTHNWILIIFAFILCYFNVTLIRLIWKKLTDYYGGLAKLIIFLQSILLIFVSLYLFRYYSIRISFSIALLAIILTPSTVLLYDKLLKAVYTNIINKLNKKTK